MVRASSGWVIGLWPLRESLADPPTMPTRRRPPLRPAALPGPAAGAADDPQPATTGGTAAATVPAPIRRSKSRREKEPVAAISPYLALRVAMKIGRASC